MSGPVSYPCCASACPKRRLYSAHVSTLFLTLKLWNLNARWLGGDVSRSRFRLRGGLASRCGDGWPFRRRFRPDIVLNRLVVRVNKRLGPNLLARVPPRAAPLLIINRVRFTIDLQAHCPSSLNATQTAHITGHNHNRHNPSTIHTQNKTIAKFNAVNPFSKRRRLSFAGHSASSPSVVSWDWRGLTTQ